MRRILLIITASLVLAGSGWFFSKHTQSATPSSGLHYDSYTLKNGMTAVLIPNDKVPAVSHMVWYKVGAIDEKSGKTGLAHMLEHMMFKGTDDVGPGQFSARVAREGGNDNAFTHYDYTGYYQNIASDRLGMVMGLEADRMQHLKVQDDLFTKEHQVVLEEWRTRIENNPQAKLTQEMRAALFPDTPYGRPIIGWGDDVKGLTAQDVRDFYHQYYYPANAVLVVAGAVDPDTFKSLAEKYYGTIPAGKPNIRKPIIAPEPTTHRVTYHDVKVKQPQLIRYYTAPQQSTKGCEECYDLSTLSYVLGESRTSLLYDELVVKQKLAAGVDSYYEDLSYGPSIFVVSATPAPGIALDVLEKAMDKVIEQATKQPIDADMLKRAKSAMIASSIYAREDPSTLAQLFGKVYALGLTGDYVTKWDDHINAVTADDVQHAAADIFNSDKHVTGLLLPATQKDGEK